MPQRSSKELAATEDGGTLEIYTYRGEVKKKESVAGSRPSPLVPPESKPDGPRMEVPASPVEVEPAGNVTQVKRSCIWPSAVVIALLLAGQTVHAVAATILSIFALQHEGLAGNVLAKILIVAALFFASAWVCNGLGLGRIVDLGSGIQISAPGYISFPFYVASAYISAWGLGLFLASLVIGVASALQIEKWRAEHAA